MSSSYGRSRSLRKPNVFGLTFVYQFFAVGNRFLNRDVLRNSAKNNNVDVINTKCLKGKINILSQVFLFARQEPPSASLIHVSFSVHADFDHQLNVLTVYTWGEALIEQTKIFTKTLDIQRTVKRSWIEQLDAFWNCVLENFNCLLIGGVLSARVKCTETHASEAELASPFSLTGSSLDWSLAAHIFY